MPYLALLTALSCGGEDLVLPADGNPPGSSSGQLLMAAGNNQSGSAGLALAEPVMVQLVDSTGHGIADQPVSWVVSTGGGSATPTNPATDADGFAAATWTLGSAGTNSLSAVVSGIGMVTFTATASQSNGGGGGGVGTLPSASASTVSADPASVQVRRVATIRVTVRDDAGAPVPGAIVTLTASGTGNTLKQPDQPTGSDGVAVGTLKSSVAGTKDVSAIVNGTIQISQTAQIFVTLAPPSRIEAVEGNNQQALVGQAVPVAPAVRVTNSAGQPVSGFTVTFVVTGGGGTVSGESQTTDADGIARVGGWTLGSNPGRNTLEAQAGSLNGSPVVFQATANAQSPPPPPPPPAAKPDHFVFRVPPHDVSRNQAFRVEVAIVDANGNVVPLNGIQIYLGLFREGHDTPSNSVVVGDRFEDTQNGIAAFNLSITDSDRYRIRALSDELPELGPHGPEPWLYSNPFEVK